MIATVSASMDSCRAKVRQPAPLYRDSCATVRATGSGPTDPRKSPPDGIYGPTAAPGAARSDLGRPIGRTRGGIGPYRPPTAVAGVAMGPGSRATATHPRGHAIGHPRANSSGIKASTPAYIGPPWRCRGEAGDTAKSLIAIKLGASENPKIRGHGVDVTNMRYRPGDRRPLVGVEKLPRASPCGGPQ
jgi:hypothetical protein